MFISNCDASNIPSATRHLSLCSNRNERSLFMVWLGGGWEKALDFDWL